MNRFIVYVTLAAALFAAAPVLLSTAYGSASSVQPDESFKPQPSAPTPFLPIMECNGGACSRQSIRLLEVSNPPLRQVNEHVLGPGETSDFYRYFYYETSTPFWSVVAVKPHPQLSAAMATRHADYDLHLYRDKSWASRAMTGSSRLPGNLVDFVAVDSNIGRMPYGKHYARTQLYSGFDDGFTIQVAAGTQTLQHGAAPQEVRMGEADIVAVRDAHLTAGQTYTFTLDSPADADAGLLVMGSRPDAPETFVQSIHEYQAGQHGGTDPTVRFTPVTTGWYGVVVLNIAGSGTYRLSLN